jgi:hypothetical protein
MKKIVFSPLSGCLLALTIIAGIIMVALMFLQGGVWLGEKALPYFVLLARITLGVVLIILLPMSAFRQTQRFAARGLMSAASIFGITLWVWGLVLTYTLWGGGAVLVGLFLLGVGVVPMAMLATAFAAMWSTFGQLFLLAVLIYATRRYSMMIFLKLKREEQKIFDLEIV